MRKLLFIVCMLAVIQSMATTYTVGTGGTFSTIAQVNATTIQPGDQILFKRNETFTGTLIINNSGTVGNSIVIGAWGTGANPVITGFVTVSGWTNLGSNIWESSSAVTSLSTLNMVSVNGVNTAMGRYPNANAANSGYLNFESHSSNTSITDSQLTDAVNWTGAEAVVRPVRWIFDRRTITSHSGGTLGFSALTYVPIDGFGYFIQNDPRTLDQAGEWYFNPSTKKLQIYSTTTPSSVKVATLNNLLQLKGSYITVENISFEGSNDDAITGDATTRSNIIIQNCSISYVGSDAISGLKTNDSTLDNLTVTNINNNGIGIDGTGNIIQYCDLANIGLFPGMGTLIYMGITAGSSTTIQYNTVQNVGYIGISFYGNDILVKNNLVDTYCKVLDDGGGIYTYTGTRTAMTNCRITGNIVLNGLGAIDGTSGNQTSTAIGIYLDNNTKNTEVDNNTVANCNTYGMLMNNPSYVNIHHNTFFNNNPQIRSTFMTGSNPVTNMTISSNKLIAKTATQGMIYLVSTEENLSSFGTINNNYYGRPMDSSGNMFMTSQPSATYVNRTFAGWKTYLSQDAASSLSTKALSAETDIAFAYNATSSPVNINFDWQGLDVTGAVVLTTATVGAWSSLVSFKNVINTGGLNKAGVTGSGKPIIDGQGRPILFP